MTTGRKGILIFSIIVYYFCFGAGFLFLIINNNALQEYNVSPGLIPFITFFSLFAAIFFTFRYKKLVNRYDNNE